MIDNDYMKDITRIRLELDINARKIMQHVEVHNEQIEHSIKSGIERGLNELFEGDNFENYIAALTKEQIRETVKQAVFDLDFRQKVQDACIKSLAPRIDEVANGWAEKVFKNSDD